MSIKLIFIGILFILSVINVYAYTVDDYQNIIFLHHSTGGNVYNEGNVHNWFDTYNIEQGTSFNIIDRAYPNSPYPWENYPYDYWNLWINDACNSADSDIECLNTLTQSYNVIIWKHCFPSSAILPDTGNPDITSSIKTSENYKLQYRALRDLMDSYPDTIFILWTLPPLHRLATNQYYAERATDFSTWQKTDFLTENGSHPNIYVFDFREIVVGVDNFLAYEYERSHSSGDSHPNTAANIVAGPIFGQFIVDSINDFIGNGTCNLPYDTAPACDNCINSNELGQTLNGWLNREISMSQLITNIKNWKSCS